MSEPIDTPATASQSVAPRRRFVPRFSLRNLLLLITMLSIAMGIYVDNARKQGEAVRHFYRLTEPRQTNEGLEDLTTMGYRYRGEDQYYKPIVPPWMNWLKNAMGEECFGEATGVQLTGTKAADADLRFLRALPKIERLSLNQTEVTDEGMYYVAFCQELRFLNLNETAITDEGLRPLAFLPHLKSLYLDKTAVTDAGLIELHSLLELQELWLKDTHVTEQGVRQLQAALPNCQIRSTVPSAMREELERSGFFDTGTPQR
ncbi:MAG: hypothetical protein AB7I37_22380 [Pirellulales bacterium]